MRIAVEIAGFSLAGADTLRKAMGKKIKELIDEQGEHFIAGRRRQGLPEGKGRRAVAADRPVRPVRLQQVPLGRLRLRRVPDGVPEGPLPVALLGGDAVERGGEHRQARGVRRPAHRAAASSCSAPTSTRRSSLSRWKATRSGSGWGRSREWGRAQAPASSRPAAAAGSSGAPRTSCGRRGTGRSTGRSWSASSAPAPSTRCTRTAAPCSPPLDKLVDQASRERQALDAGQGFLFGFDEAEETLPAAGTAPSTEELLKGERETLGFYLSGHPLDRWARVLKELRATPVAELPQLAAAGAERVVVGGLVSALKVRPIKDGRNQGRRMASFTLEDQTGTVRVVAFPDVFERFERSLARRGGGAGGGNAEGERRRARRALARGGDPARGDRGAQGRRPASGAGSQSLRRARGAGGVAGAVPSPRRPPAAAPAPGGPAWSAEVVPTRVMGVNPATLIPALTPLLGAGRAEFVFD